MSDRHVVGVEIVLPDRAHDHVPVLMPTRISRFTPLSARSFGVAADLLLHAEGGVEGALRMVLLGDRCPEQGEDTVACRLRDVALVTVNRIG